MSEAPALGQTTGQGIGTQDVRLSIARAAQATGINFDYLLAQAKLESSLDPNARAGTSSAAGLYQFIGSTWLQTVDRHGANHGLDWAGAAISNGRADPAMRSQIMALRYDPDAASLMAAELARDNQSALRQSLGREPDFSELYLAHFMGSDGAARFLAAMQANPDQSASALFPKQAAANRGVFFGAGGAPRSLAEVMDHFRGRMERAMGDENGAIPFATGLGRFAGFQPPRPGPTQTETQLGPLAREFHDAAASHRSGTRVTMVDTLRQTFGDGEGQTARLPDNIRAAYSKLKAYDL